MTQSDSHKHQLQQRKSNYEITEDRDLLSRYHQIRQGIRRQPTRPVEFDSFLVVIEMYRRSKQVVMSTPHYILPQLHTAQHTESANLEALVESAQSVETGIRTLLQFLLKSSNDTEHTPYVTLSQLEEDLVISAFARYQDSDFANRTEIASPRTSYPDYLDFSEITETSSGQTSVTVNEIAID
ncbi:MAG: hypothetical protein AAGJ35_03095 [Myxococcota bacterium]